MIIDRTTMTGSDNSTNIDDLIDLSSKYSFVEWGVLVSKSHSYDGFSRFPCENWLQDLASAQRKHQYINQLKLCCHICGSWVKDILGGKNSLEFAFPGLLSMFQRIQLNFHGKPHSLSEAGIDLLKNDPVFCGKQIIFQNDVTNARLFYQARSCGINAVPLFDLSHGAGIVPEQWPVPINAYCGYAGGLGPDNLEEQVNKINNIPIKHVEFVDHGEHFMNVVYHPRIWVDMETKVRTEEKFDLTKVDQCLNIMNKYIL